MGKNTTTNTMKVPVPGTSLKESEKKVYESQCKKKKTVSKLKKAKTVHSEYIVNIFTGHSGINFLYDCGEAKEEE